MKTMKGARTFEISIEQLKEYFAGNKTMEQIEEENTDKTKCKCCDKPLDYTYGGYCEQCARELFNTEV